MYTLIYQNDQNEIIKQNENSFLSARIEQTYLIEVKGLKKVLIIENK